MSPRAILPVLITSVAIAGCGSASGEPNGSDPQAVQVAPVTQELLAPPVAATGTLHPKEEIGLGFKVGGVIARVLVDEGAVVRAGQTLATLELREIDAAVSRARSAADKAERDLARARRLFADSVMTLVQVQDAETGAEVANADLETARFNRRYAVITAPAAGVILRRHAEPGELISANTPVLVLGSRERGAVVQVGLADRDVVRVRKGDRATVRFDALPEREFGGKVTEIAAAAEPATGTYAVEIGLPEGGGRDLMSGLVGKVEIQPSGARPTTLIPIEALLEADGSTGTVYALSTDGSRAERRRVTVGFITGDRVAVAAGLEGVKSVITGGLAYLNDGEAVRVVP